MHGRVVNEARLDLALWPEGPLLIKAADTGVDPTRPDMEFVRTRHAGAETVYLPGSSLKGALRAQCERIARTVGGTDPDGRPRLSCNPLTERREGANYACSARLRELARRDARGFTSVVAYRESCAICQLFGNTAEAAHLRLADAYPTTAPRLEPRSSVAIDRVYGSVAAGPFHYEVLAEGRFATQITVRNFTLAQLGLLALALRDLAEGRLALGFGKSRGFGRVGAEVSAATIRYPGAEVRDGTLVTLAGETVGPADALHGVGDFPNTRDYGFPSPDATALPDGQQAEDDGWGAATVTVPGTVLGALWPACVARWAELARGAVAS